MQTSHTGTADEDRATCKQFLLGPASRRRGDTNFFCVFMVHQAEILVFVVRQPYDLPLVYIGATTGWLSKTPSLGTFDKKKHKKKQVSRAKPMIM